MRNLWWALFFVPSLALADNQIVNESQLIGKWQCQLNYLNNEMSIKQISTIHILKDGTINEHIKRYEGKEKSYQYQIEDTYAKLNWRMRGNRVVFDDYRIDRYSIRMPNAKQDDFQALDTAAQKTLVTVQKMINPALINYGDFDIQWLGKNKFEKYQDDETLICKKKWF